MYDFLIGPFAEFDFMRRALIGVLALGVGAGPVGVLMMLRRMSLAGDAMAHAILPGAAIGFLAAGLNLFAMTIGGLVAGFAVALGAGAVARATEMKEDAALAAFYLISLALGVLLVSLRGSNVDLLHVLFGSVLALDDPTLLLTAGIATATLLALALIYRPLIVECFDPGFLRLQGRQGALAHAVFMLLLVLNLVGGFHSLGTLMAVAFVVLPAAAARFWVRSVGAQMALAMAAGVLGSVIGLLVSFHLGIAASAAITLSLGALYALSLLAGTHGSVRAHRRRAAQDSVWLNTGVSP